MTNTLKTSVVVIAAVVLLAAVLLFVHNRGSDPGTEFLKQVNTVDHMDSSR